MKRIVISLICLVGVSVLPQASAHPVQAASCGGTKCPQISIGIAYPAAGQYSVRLFGDYLQTNTNVTWRILTPHGEVTGSFLLAGNPFYIVASTHSCPSGHITVDAKGRADSRLGGEELATHYEGQPC